MVVEMTRGNKVQTGVVVIGSYTSGVPYMPAEVKMDMYKEGQRD